MTQALLSPSNTAPWVTSSPEHCMKESETNTSSHFDYAGSYKITGIYQECTMQTIALPTPAILSFHPITDDIYDMDICLRNRICGRIHVAPNNDDMINDMDEAFDDIVGISNLGFLTSKLQSAPDLLELVLANVLSECDMIRFTGDRLVLEGPGGALECSIQ